MREHGNHDWVTPILLGAVTGVALEIARRAFRESQLFCPGRKPSISWNPVDYGLPRETEVHEIPTADGERLYAWYCRAKNPIASALVCHGNKGNITTPGDVAIARYLVEAGVNVLLFDYRGFGRSSGRPRLEEVLADARVAAEFHDRLRPHDLPSILYGFSLGGGIAAQTIKDHPVDALILQSTFTNLSDLTRALWPRLPLYLLTGRLFDTMSVIRNLTIPLLVLHGRADEVAPCWMAHALHDACPSTKEIHVVEGALHKDLWTRDSESLVRTIHRFASALTHGDSVATDRSVVAADHGVVAKAS